MRRQILAALVAISIGAVMPSLAVEINTTKADCEKHGMRWKNGAGRCVPPLEDKLSKLEHITGVIGIACALGGLVIVFREWQTLADNSGPPVAPKSQ
jgi:hypothetical protein